MLVPAAAIRDRGREEVLEHPQPEEGRHQCADCVGEPLAAVCEQIWSSHSPHQRILVSSNYLGKVFMLTIITSAPDRFFENVKGDHATIKENIRGSKLYVDIRSIDSVD